MGVCTVPEESKAEESKSEKLEAGLLLCEWATVVVVVAFFFFLLRRGVDRPGHVLRPWVVDFYGMAISYIQDGFMNRHL